MFSPLNYNYRIVLQGKRRDAFVSVFRNAFSVNIFRKIIDVL